MNTQELLDKINNLIDYTNMTYLEREAFLKSVEDHIDNTYTQGRNDGYDSGFSTCLSLHTNNY